MRRDNSNIAFFSAKSIIYYLIDGKVGQRTGDEIKGFGGDVTLLAADIAKGCDAAMPAKEVVACYGRIDVLDNDVPVNNVSISDNKRGTPNYIEQPGRL